MHGQERLSQWSDNHIISPRYFPAEWTADSHPPHTHTHPSEKNNRLTSESVYSQSSGQEENFVMCATSQTLSAFVTAYLRSG